MSNHKFSTLVQFTATNIIPKFENFIRSGSLRKGDSFHTIQKGKKWSFDSGKSKLEIVQSEKSNFLNILESLFFIKYIEVNVYRILFDFEESMSDFLLSMFNQKNIVSMRERPRNFLTSSYYEMHYFFNNEVPKNIYDQKSFKKNVGRYNFYNLIEKEYQEDILSKLYLNLNIESNSNLIKENHFRDSLFKTENKYKPMTNEDLIIHMKKIKEIKSSRGSSQGLLAEHIAMEILKIKFENLEWTSFYQKDSPFDFKSDKIKIELKSTSNDYNFRRSIFELSYRENIVLKDSPENYLLMHLRTIDMDKFEDIYFDELNDIGRKKLIKKIIEKENLKYNLIWGQELLGIDFRRENNGVKFKRK